MKTINPRTKKRLNLMALFVCCLLAASFTNARTTVGQTIKTTDTKLNKIDAGTLSKEGPRFPNEWFFNRFSARVLSRTGPMVVEYQLGGTSTATILLTVNLDGKETPFPFLLKQTGGEIQQKKFQLPKELGSKPVATTLTVIAESSDKQPPDFFLYGLCMGEQACGSLNIDTLRFQPPRVRASKNEKVQYSFHSRADFEQAFVEFRLLGPTGSDPMAGLVSRMAISGIRQDESKSGEWDGRNQKGKVSHGRHLFVVSAWYGEKTGGAWVWVSDSSRQRVTIE